MSFLKEIKTEKGVLKCKMPDILEYYSILIGSGISKGVTDPIEIRINTIKAMEPLMIISELDGYNSYQDLLADSENMLLPLSEMADDLVSKLLEVFKKKPI
jgi:hypothetical protein